MPTPHSHNKAIDSVTWPGTFRSQQPEQLKMLPLMVKFTYLPRISKGFLLYSVSSSSVIFCHIQSCVAWSLPTLPESPTELTGPGAGVEVGMGVGVSHSALFPECAPPPFIQLMSCSPHSDQLPRHPQRGSWLSLPSNTPALLLPITLILPIRPSLAGFSLVAGGFYFIQVSLFQNCSVCISLCHAESLLAQCASSMDISEWRKGPLCS